MSDPTYRLTEIVGTSAKSVDDAIRSAIARADKTLRNLDWFQVSEVRGMIKEGQVAQYQVSMKVGFRVDEG
jgi:flavin-binding protein dodecin